MNNLEKSKLVNAFEDKFSGTPQLIVRAPGRINLIGEHTDYNNGFVLPAAIDKEIIFAIGLSGNDVFHLYSIDLEEDYLFKQNELNISQEKKWANYLVGVVAQYRKKGYEIPALNVAFGGNVPLGAGLSSSAAVECGLAFAINELMGYGLPKEELAHMAQKAEHEFAGVQ